MKDIRHNWTSAELLDLYNTPLLELVHRAAMVHRQFHDSSEVQVSSLLSIKTGGCSEDCGYCPQSAKYNTNVKVHKMLPVKEVVEAAQNAKQGGASRMCLGAAWREVRDNRDFDTVIEMVKAINKEGMEVCCTLGMLTEEQAQKLSDAGVYAYNHNLDTSAEFYNEIITTRTYEDRLNTLDNVRKAGMTICSGGIIGMGESIDDRLGMLKTLSGLVPHPESVPINALVPVEGTPLEDQQTVSSWEMIRMVAVTRIVMPGSVVRLSAGRMSFSPEAQAMCFLAGANSIFAGDKLLTTPNPDFNEDKQLLDELGLHSRKAFKYGKPKVQLTSSEN
ncbi:MAG TPA: biotin synthase BioB [Bacteroidia bacterium]|jgi:biotin synthase|nr:biotin synthase BioB [Bacteroidia bacterium]